MVAEQEAAWAVYDEAGPLPINWEWYRARTPQRPMGARCFVHMATGTHTPIRVEGDGPPPFGGLADLTWPPSWPPASLQRQREKYGLLATPVPPPDAPTLTREQAAARDWCASAIRGLMRGGASDLPIGTSPGHFEDGFEIDDEPWSDDSEDRAARAEMEAMMAPTPRLDGDDGDNSYSY